MPPEVALHVYNLGALNKDVISSMVFIHLWLSKCASSRSRDFLSGRSPSLPTWDLRYILNIEKPKHFSSKRLQTPSSPAGKHMFQWVSRLRATHPPVHIPLSSFWMSPHLPLSCLYSRRDSEWQSLASTQLVAESLPTKSRATGCHSWLFPMSHNAHINAVPL